MRNRVYQEYLNSEGWQEKRILLFNERGYNCEECGSNKSIQVHHLTYDNIFNEPLSDLKLLCDVCHSAAHGLHKRRKKKKKEHKNTKYIRCYLASLGIPHDKHRKCSVRALKRIWGVNIKDRTTWNYIANRAMKCLDEFKPLIEKEWKKYNRLTSESNIGSSSIGK